MKENNMRGCTYTVAYLIEKLKTFEQDAVVILAIDSEGNGYSEVNVIESGVWNGRDFGLASLSKEEKDDGYSKKDIVKGVAAVCFCP